MVDDSNRTAQKGTNARWTLKIGGKIRYRPDRTPLSQIALPVFSYKSHINIDRRFGLIRQAAVTSAIDVYGWQLRRLISKDNTAGHQHQSGASNSSVSGL